MSSKTFLIFTLVFALSGCVEYYSENDLKSKDWNYVSAYHPNYSEFSDVDGPAVRISAIYRLEKNGRLQYDYYEEEFGIHVVETLGLCRCFKQMFVESPGKPEPTEQFWLEPPYRLELARLVYEKDNRLFLALTILTLGILPSFDSVESMTIARLKDPSGKKIAVYNSNKIRVKTVTWLPLLAYTVSASEEASAEQYQLFQIFQQIHRDLKERKFGIGE